MSDQVTKGKTDSKTEEAPPVQEAKDIKDEKLEEDTDALMDAIDEVLEQDAEEFVKNYVQRGGE